MSDGDPQVPEDVVPDSAESESAVAEGLRLREERGASRGPLRHDRSLPLPFRVKSGQIRDDALVVETAQETHTFPWSEVRLVALGIIEEKMETDAASYNIEKLMGGMSRMIKGSGGRDEGRITSFRETHLVDLYLEGRPEPFRLDSAHVNYRAFLGDISYVSFQNVFRLVHGLASHATSSRFTPAVQNFLCRRRDRTRKFGAVYDFELDTQNCLQHLENQPAWEDLSLERTTWAEEWSEG